MCPNPPTLPPCTTVMCAGVCLSILCVLFSIVFHRTCMCMFQRWCVKSCVCVCLSQVFLRPMGLVQATQAVSMAFTPVKVSPPAPPLPPHPHLSPCLTWTALRKPSAFSIMLAVTFPLTRSKEQALLDSSLPPAAISVLCCVGQTLLVVSASMLVLRT